jgi:hypothetical protein
MKLPAGLHVPPGMRQHVASAEPRQLPLVGDAGLPLDLMDLGWSHRAVQSELDTLTYLAKRLDGDRFGIADKHLKQLPNRPPTLIAIAELVGFAAGQWTHASSPDYAVYAVSRHLQN